MAVYNSQHPYMFWRGGKPLIIGVALGLLLMAAAARAAEWSAPARSLAQKIVEVTGPGAVALEVSNRSSLRPAEVEQARGALVSELSALGVQVLESGQSATVRVTFSENARNYLWIAQVRQGAGEEKVLLVSVAGAPAGGSFGPASPISIHRTLLWSQDAPILDATLLPGGNPQHLLVLDPKRVALFSSAGGQWRQEQQFPIAHARPWPRDLRGRIVFNNEHLFDLYLPGVVCGAVLSTPLSMACHEADDPWPLGMGSSGTRGFFSPARNFFTGVVAPPVGKQDALPAFYSAAPLPRAEYVLWALAAVDGSAHLVDGVNDLTPKVPWGSDIAAVKSGCGSGWQILASSRNDAGDSLRAWEILDREPAPVGTPAQFSGPLTALWSKDDGSAVAVEHNPDTGKYDAYSLAIACHQ
ncbi:MAG TPA: hypothetical protein VLC12_08120 [Terriglobales bacterium]|nr:hypothetical protein [Terriglobales bacterium]